MIIVAGEIPVGVDGGFSTLIQKKLCAVGNEYLCHLSQLLYARR